MKTASINKLEIADTQLRHSIELFLEGRELISVITLAGAAEEILGMLAEKAGHVHALKRKANCARSLHNALWGNDTDPGTKPFVALNNKAKNELKHMISGNRIALDLEDEAMKLLDRAVENYRLMHARTAPFIQEYERRRLVLWRKRHGR